MADREGLSPAMAKLADEIIGNGIDADEVLRLRQEVFRDGVVNREEAKLLFYLNEAAGGGNDQAWYDFFVEALTDFFVRKQRPVGYLSDEDADFLVAEITRDGKIDNCTEFGLLVSILRQLRASPEKVIVLGLEGVRQTVLEGGTVLFGPRRRRPGVIDAADVDIISTVVYAGGGGSSLTITRREAELIFELNHRTAGQDNAPEWRELFVHAIANHLMFPRGAPDVPDRAEAARRERWLDERRGVGAFMKEMSGTLNPYIFTGTADEMWQERRHGAERRAEAEHRAVSEAFARESIDQPEAAWLIERIREQGGIDDNEKALLAFIKENSPRIDPSLDPLFDEAGL